MSSVGRAVVVCVAALSLPWALPRHAGAENYERQTIKNTTGRAVNDLTVFFDNEVTAAKIRPKAQPPGSTSDGAVRPSKMGADFAQDTFGKIENGGSAYLDYAHGGQYVNVQATSFWTDNGEVAGGVGRIGSGMFLTLDQFNNNAKLGVQNMSTAPQHYQDLQVQRSIPESHYNFEQFADGTGALVSGLPTSFDLNPGQQLNLDLGPIDYGGYYLATATVWPVGEPGDLYDIAYATAVPEPGTLSLMGLAGAALLLRRRRA